MLRHRQLALVPKAKDIAGKLNAAVVELLADPAVRRRLAELGQEAVPREQQTSEVLGAFRKTEIEVADYQGGQHQGRVCSRADAAQTSISA